MTSVSIDRKAVRLLTDTTLRERIWQAALSFSIPILCWCGEIIQLHFAEPRFGYSQLNHPAIQCSFAISLAFNLIGSLLLVFIRNPWLRAVIFLVFPIFLSFQACPIREIAEPYCPLGPPLGK
jgi:hypothetical protein